ncbi:MAG: cellulase family glycosylhydrolase [Bacteroidota bacterium]|nr:cellulase family glycosylhydrolase [Bacteroidota bacterium]
MKNKLKLSAVVFLLCGVLTPSLSAEGFLKVVGTNIENDNGNIQLRGIGLGGWMLPEGYMVLTSGFADAFWQMKNKVNEVVGPEKADSFWTMYRKNFVTRKDIEQISKWGFNSVRMVLHYEFFMLRKPTGFDWKTDGFIILDSLVQRCAENKIYVILDLHAAPGGQSANNISDYNSTLPSLWQSDTNKAMTMSLWKKLADHYKNEPWIGGYDILNEPAWDLPPNNQPLRDLYVAITDSIRSVDTTHIIFAEGNWYASDFNGLTPPWDAKMVYSFHKYWNSNDPGSITPYLNLRSSTNRPLWLGESGENSNQWFSDCIALMESNNIGWSWWTYKRIDTPTSLVSVNKNSDYDYLLKYWSGQVTKPSVDYAMTSLVSQADRLNLDQCVLNPGVIDAMFRQPFTDELKPYAQNIVPGRVLSINYDMGKNLLAYKDNDYQSVGGGSWNNGGQYRNDGVDIEKCSDLFSGGYNVGWTNDGEYLRYTIDVQQSGSYSVDIRCASLNGGGQILFQLEDNSNAGVANIAATGGWQTWKTFHVGQIPLSAGIHKLRLLFLKAGFNLTYIQFSTVDAVGKQNDDNIPKVFALSQNFPNPFNPSTVINYQVPKKSFVELKVFNILGNEVASLVKETQPAGAYSVNFSASHLSSGVYFYSLSADNFFQTKKLTLLK